MNSVPDEDTLTQLLHAQRDLERSYAATVQRVRNGYHNTVTLARAKGMDWATIAHHLDTTPEAARKRYERGQ